MITKLTVTNHLDETTVFNMRDWSENGFAVTKIDGVGPGSATVAYTELSALDGAVQTTSRIGTRGITITVVPQWLPTQSIEEARLRLYRIFPLKREIKLVLTTEVREASISGYVESVEPDIFSNMVGVTIQLVCMTPYFQSTRDEIVQSLTLNADNTVHYPGDTDVGVELRLRCRQQNTNSVTVKVNGMTFFVDAEAIKTVQNRAHGFMKDDVYLIRTIPGRKNSWLIYVSDGSLRAYNGLYAATGTTEWFYFHPGDNTVRVETAGNPPGITADVTFIETFIGM